MTFKESSEIQGGVWGLVAGGDGAVWFTTASAINRMTMDGAIQTFPTSGYPENLLVGPDKNVWFTERATGALPTRIARVSPAGALSEFPVPDGERVLGQNLVVGEDGALWGVASSSPFINGNAVELKADVIRVTMNGDITRYALPANFGPSAFGLRSIVARVGGGVWVSLEQDRADTQPNHVIQITPLAAYLGSVTPDGRLTPAALPSGEAHEPTLIGSDATGTLWTELGDGQTLAFYRVAPSGAVTMAVPNTAPNFGGHADASTVDMAGGFWYTQRQGGALHSTSIYHVAADGTVAAYPYGRRFSVKVFPSDAQTADAVIAGPEGAIWFTERLSDAIGRATPSGVITDFPLPTPAHTISLLGAFIVGTDNTLWYARNYYDSADGAPVSGVLGWLIL